VGLAIGDHSKMISRMMMMMTRRVPTPMYMARDIPEAEAR
jgi:hypothetical protein